VLDNIDFDQAIHLLAETLAVKPSLVRKPRTSSRRCARPAGEGAAGEGGAAEQAQASAVRSRK
jgi:hypothetical protein